ncbi:DUF6354 family protein [Streptomyces odonnellii]|uniref:DUF6354 family protein n=1 Tax=Streptomyces odonnellii TaxID=1417980 RepID=UPI0006259D3E|nr:DUF6354 family protein [Streptomyces odonnellii]
MQLHRDLNQNMGDRDRRLRMGAIGPNGRATCVIKHDLHLKGAPIWRTTHISTAAIPRSYTHATYNVLGLGDGAA